MGHTPVNPAATDASAAAGTAADATSPSSQAPHPPPPHPPGIRQARKQQTRRALLEAALRLLEHSSLGALGLREVTREAGIAPAAFYRHFADVRELGVALVDDSFGSLHALARDARADRPATEEVIRRTVEVIAAHVREHRPQLEFLARERHGSVQPVRAAIAAHLDAFADELAADLAAQPEAEGWSAADLRVLAEMYVNHTLLTATALLDAAPGDEAAQRRITATARTQLQLIAVGRRHWLSDRP